MKDWNIIVGENRMIGFTIGFTGNHKEDLGSEVEQETISSVEVAAPYEQVSLLEYDIGEHPLGVNIIPECHVQSNVINFTETVNVMYDVIKIVAKEIGIAPETLTKRVQARIKEERKRKRLHRLTVEGDLESWYDRI